MKAELTLVVTCDTCGARYVPKTTAVHVFSPKDVDGQLAAQVLFTPFCHGCNAVADLFARSNYRDLATAARPRVDLDAPEEPR